MQRIVDISPAIIIPILLSLCLICVVVGGLIFLLSPSNVNPLEGLVLRVYLLQNDEALNNPYGDDTQPRPFRVSPNDAARSIGINLVTAGMIGNGTLFQRYAQFEGLDDELQTGTFCISNSMDIPAILNALTVENVQNTRFLIRENMRIEEIKEQIDTTPELSFSGDDFYALVNADATIPEYFRTRYGIPEGHSLEGFLYPATYDVSSAMDANCFRQMLLDRFEIAINQDIWNAATAQDRSIFDLVRMASIIERETVVESERSIIASVYWNRIAQGMTLDADPTVQYQLANLRQDGTWWPSITQADYVTATGPYNTYLNPGLPYGPIVSPAQRSIAAAAMPENTSYLYFQRSCANDGSHVFFETGTDHLAYFQFRLNGCQ